MTKANKPWPLRCIRLDRVGIAMQMAYIKVGLSSSYAIMYNFMNKLDSGSQHL
jgi:hypothetical protein